MTLFALGLVLVSAVFHAGWNLALKRADGGIAFLWLVNLTATVWLTPLAIWVVLHQQSTLGWLAVAFMGGSATLHLLYFVCLQRGYRVGDLSLVYPLARGTGPVLSTLGAIVLFGERPSPLAIAGALVIAVSVFVLTGGESASPATRQAALLYGLLTGAIIAIYTLWDTYAVATLAIPPLLMNWTTTAGQAVLFAPAAGRTPGIVAKIWRLQWKAVLAVAILSPLAYLLVLTALSFTPVSYVAPTREIGILFGAAMGARWLAEGDVRRRLLAAAGMVLGVVALAIG